MSRLALPRTLERRGWPVLAGLACLLVALLLLAAVAGPLAAQRQDLQKELGEVRERMRIGGEPTGPARDNSAAAQLRRFHAGFPTVETAADWLVQINAAARRSGIVLSAGEYRLEPRGADTLRRYAVVLPVRGSYGQVRSFVESALAAVPSAALDNIEMRRDAASDAVLEAKVRLTLYLRDTPP